MKRPYCMMLALALAASLAACGGQGESAPSATATPQPAEMAETTSTEETAALPAVAGELYPILPADDTHMWFNTGTRGYQMKWENDHGLVMVIDYDTAEQRVLCSVPGCTHDAEPCPAYFPGVRQNCQLFVAGEEVYLYKRWEGEYLPDTWEEYEQSMQLPQGTQPQDAEEEMAFRRAYYEQAVKPAGLMIVAADGSAKRYVELSQNLGVDSWLRWCDGAALYGYNSDAPGSGGQKLYRVSLADGTVSALPLRDGEWPSGALGRKLIVEQFVTKVPLPNSAENYEAYDAVRQNGYYELDLLDPATGERSKLVADPAYSFDSMFLGQAGGWLYFRITEERDPQWGVVRAIPRAYDPQTGQWKELGGPEMRISDVEIYALPGTAAWEGRWVWIHGNSEQMWVLDRQTGEQHAVTQKVEKASAVDQRMAAAAVTDDGRFLIPIREREPYTDVYDYALIDADAFLQGSTDYTLVTPVE